MVNMNRLLSYLKYMEEQGFASSEVLDGTGLSRENLNFNLFCPSPSHYQKMITNILALTSDDIGINIGDSWRISNLGILGYALISCQTINELGSIWSRYNCLADPMLSYNNETNGDIWSVELSEIFPLGGLLPFVVEEHMARVFRTIPDLTGATDFGFYQLQLSYAPPPYAERYRQHFQCDVKFNQTHNRILLNSKYLSDKLNFANEEVFTICDQQCQRLMNEYANSGELSSRIKRILIHNPGKLMNLREISNVLDISERSIRRQLREEGTNYKALHDHVRKELALQYMQCTNLKPKEISYVLGFSNVSNFRRAFKVWTNGHRLSDYR